MTDFGENQQYILKLLVTKNLINSQDLIKAKDYSQKKNMRIIDSVVEIGILSEESILKELANDLSLDFISIFHQKIDPVAIEKISIDVAKEYHIMPINIHFETIIIATTKPLDLTFIDNLKILLNMQIDTVVATYNDIKEAIGTYYKAIDTINPANTLHKHDDENLINYLNQDQKNIDKEDAPVIRLVSSIIIDAFRLRASDIHLEPMKNIFRIRYRIDGVLIEVKKFPKQLQAPITSRVKLLADMKLAEKRLPQDGKIKLNIKHVPIDIRVSSLPGVYGESVVMRILNKKELSLGLPTLGFLSDTEKIWKQLINIPNGVILITGPTGSGKTTTLYSCLNALNQPERKIITVEDPIEYQLVGINQVQIREDIDLTFSKVLRSCLRQAPNIIMVGEIRDSETARIAMNAAFTGHLVFSTLHTNDASGAITRLIDQDIEPFLVASAVRGILAQRLVRKICPQCKVSYPASDYEKGILNIKNENDENILIKGVGCSLCNGTGYKGRTGIFELLVLDPLIQEMVYEIKSSSQIREVAIKNGMRTLREDAILKVLNGTTTIDELLRVTKIGET